MTNDWSVVHHQARRMNFSLSAQHGSQDLGPALLTAVVHLNELPALDAAVAAPSLQPASSMNGPSRPAAPALVRPSRYPRPCGSVELAPDTRSGRQGPYSGQERTRRDGEAWAGGRQALGPRLQAAAARLRPIATICSAAFMQRGLQTTPGPWVRTSSGDRRHGGLSVCSSFSRDGQTENPVHGGI